MPLICHGHDACRHADMMPPDFDAAACRYYDGASATRHAVFTCYAVAIRGAADVYYRRHFAADMFSLYATLLLMLMRFILLP